MSDRDEAIQKAREVLATLPQDDPDRPRILSQQSLRLEKRSSETRDTKDLDEAMLLSKEAVQKLPRDSPVRKSVLRLAFMQAEKRYASTNSSEDLDDIIAWVVEFLSIIPANDVHRGKWSLALGARLLRRASVMDSDADLEEAIRYLRIAIRLHSPEAPFELAEALVQLGLCFGARYHFSGSLEDLKGYSASLRKAVDMTPKEHPSRDPRLARFKTSVQEQYAKVSVLMRRWKMKINPDNLVERERLPVPARDVFVSAKDGSLLSLTATQKQPSANPVQNEDGKNDANQAIDLLRHGIDILSLDDEHYEKFLVELITALALRHSTNMTSENSIADLEETIRLCESFLQNDAATQTNKLKVMAIYSRNLVLRFKRLGILGDLNEAIQVRRKLLDLETETEGSIPRLLNLHFLSASLLSRCQRTGSKDDMDETIAIRRKLLLYPPPSEEYRISIMNSLVLALRLRCAMLHSLKDLDEAIQLQNEILDLTSEDDESRPHALNELGIAFLQRFVSGRNPEDLAMAIRLCREAVDTDSSMTLDRAFRLFCLARCYRERLVALNNKSDIEEMVKLSRQVIELSPVPHYGRGEFLGQLGYSLLLQTMGQGPAKSKDRDEGLLLIRQALGYKETPAVIRLLYCHEALIHCMTNEKWEEGLAIAEMGMRIMPELILRSQQNMDRQRSLRRFSGIASFAAAFALQLGRDPVEALLFLESGRGLLIASLEELRSDVRGLQDAHRDLADEFEHLRSQLDGDASLSSNTMSLETFKEAVLTNSSPTQTDQRHFAEQALDELLTKIRSKPGFEDFLQVTPSEQAMRHAAKEGPIVVINVNELRCDAIIVEESQIRHVPLPKLKWKDVKTSANRGQALSAGALEWLWDCIACPVLEMLGFSQTPSAGRWPRIWWIPTGALSTLPLHAAGRDSSDSSDTVLDRVMSSYSPSIKAIIHGRKRQLSLLNEASKDRAILVAMEHTPNAPSLPFAPGEVKIVRQLSQSLGLMPVEPGSTLEQVSNELRQCKIFHFAGHGSTDATDPSRSHLLLQEGRAKSLNVAALMDMNLQKESPPFLAYLSACGTGRIKDVQLFDESVHLISGFQLAGFRHVIGTLWEVNDETCVHMAKLVYEGLQEGGLKDEGVCLALHNATRVLRDRWHDMVVSRGSDLVSEAEEKKDQVGGHKVEQGEAASRDIVPFDDDEEQRREPLLWATYVHFGV